MALAVKISGMLECKYWPQDQLCERHVSDTITLEELWHRVTAVE